jgi:two-component system, OmpR family, sensor kinase
MKISKSIKWRLQIWYGLILVVVLAGFGFTAYHLESNQQFDRIDNELHRRIGALANSLHHPPPHRPGFDFDRPPPNQMDQPPDRDMPGLHENAWSGNHPLPAFHLSPQDAHFFDASDPHDFYFKITQLNLHGDTEIASSTNFPKGQIAIRYTSPILTNTLLLPQQTQIHYASPMPANMVLLPQFTPKPPPVETFGHYRETAELLPSDELIQVGCSIAPELHELKITALRLAVFGGVILLFGLAGGWWFVGRALRPISEISSAATKISGGNLSERINVAEAESELGQLANVLNSTFARLETAFAQQRQFASDAAHELRTPVAVILTQTQTTLNRERDAAGYKQTLEACQRAAQRMRKLIESLLALARLDAGQEVLKHLRLDLSKTVDESVTLVKPLAFERGIKMITELEPLEINGDSERLAQVATNLLANAIQYNKPEGEVRVALKSENGLAVLTVADSGKGISAEDLPRVFERFYRADKSRTGASNTGLGLAICQAIVAAHAGTIEVSSQENMGTTFIVRLPMT